jgi:acyl carrier protein
MNNTEIYDKITEILMSNYSLKKEEITLEADFKNDLELDSLDMVELAMKLECEYDILIPDSDFWKVRTVQNLIDTILTNLN